MPSIPRPIWQILMIASQPGTEVTLTCDECYWIMEYLIDEALRGADMADLRKAARRHLAHCPDCHTHYEERLNAIETMLKSP